MNQLTQFLLSWADVAIFILTFLAYAFIWRQRTPNIDLDILIESVKAGLTAASILLPGLLLVIDNIVSLTDISLSTIYIALIWVSLSIAFGVINLFTLPTIVGNIETEQGDRIVIKKKPQIFYALLQLITILLVGVRIIIGAFLVGTNG